MLQTLLYIQIIRVNFLPARLSDGLSHKHHFLGPSEQMPPVIVSIKVASGRTRGGAGLISRHSVTQQQTVPCPELLAKDCRCQVFGLRWFGRAARGTLARLPVLEGHLHSGLWACFAISHHWLRRRGGRQGHQVG